MKQSLLAYEIKTEHDVVGARQRARQIASLLGFDRQEQIRLATAVSEVGRNAFQYAGGGRLDFTLDEIAPPAVGRAFCICLIDNGPGIANLDQILEGRHVTWSGRGAGICNARKLVDQFSITTRLGEGTQIRMIKALPMRSPSVIDLERIAAALTVREPTSLLEEMQRQNQDLLQLMEILRIKEAELEKTNQALHNNNQELEETNRGVVALYMELDEKAEDLKKASSMKSQFLSYMSHEFRTPVNSIISLSRILLERFDGGLTAEQEKQIQFIQSASEDVLGMVNDLLDLSRAEAGKAEVHSEVFHLGELMSALKGLMRPIHSNPDVELVFEDFAEEANLETDRGKLNQILRNLISNALKFTERGTVTVSARIAGPNLVLAVIDTGIGIPLSHQLKIFEDYAQVDSPLQRRLKGTGLGLPLVKKLSELLGGNVTLTSIPGEGSHFTVVIPTCFQHQRIHPPLLRPEREASEALLTDARVQVPILPDENVLIVDDEESSRYILRDLLKETPFGIIEAASGETGIEMAAREHPAVIFLDLVMPGMSGLAVLNELQQNSRTASIPVVVRTSKVLSQAEQRELSAGAVAVLSKESTSREQALADIRNALAVALKMDLPRTMS